MKKADQSVIDRFVDTMWSQHGLSDHKLSAYRRDLEQLSIWLNANKQNLLEAQRQFSDRGQSIAAVGAQLGFTEPGNFSRFFLRAAGESPASWRARTWPPELPLPVSKDSQRDG